MFATWVLLAIVVGLLRRGRLQGLLDLPFRWSGLVVLAFLLRLSLHLVGLRGLDLADALVWTVQAVSYGLLLLAVVINRRVPGIPTLGAGVVANGLVILANSGRMPVSAEAAEAVGHTAAFARLVQDGSYLHQALAGQSRLTFLADVFATPSWLPVRTVFSVGDVLILVGIFILIQHLMLRPALDRPVRAGVA